MQQAILDGVNVINFSISGGAQPYTDPVELAFLDATNAGISVNASAGNAGPGAGDLRPRRAVGDDRRRLDGPALVQLDPAPDRRRRRHVRRAGRDADQRHLVPDPGGPRPRASRVRTRCARRTLAAGTATGKVVVCQRGANGRVDKGLNVLAGGAAGMILYNPINAGPIGDRQPLAAGDPRRRSERPRCSPSSTATRT